MEFKNLWDIESAMQVLASETVDGKLWAEAVEWLMLYGPPEIKKMLLDASASATSNTFPDLKPSDYTEDGKPIYDVKELAKSLGISEEEVKEVLAKKEQEHQLEELLPEEGNKTVH